MSSLLISCCLASSLLTQSPHLSVKQPSGKSIDREVQIQVEKLEPFQEIEIKAEAPDQKGNLWFSMGGSRIADAKASADSWKQLVAFFKKTLKQPTTQEHIMRESNQEKFAALRKFNLPIDQYAIIGSGPLGIRNIKAIGDIDIIVTPQLWDTVAKEYGITDVNGVKKIVFPGGIVEAFCEGSFYSAPADPQAPNMASRIKNAEIIDGLPFDSIENVLYYKRKDAREKDLKDIHLIEEWMRVNKKTTG